MKASPRYRTIIFVTAQNGVGVPILQQLVSRFSELALRSTTLMKMDVVPALAPDLTAKVIAEPEQYFLVVPAIGAGEKEKGAVCAPGILRDFCGDSHDVTGVMIHCDVDWEDSICGLVAQQLCTWMEKLSTCPPDQTPWKKTEAVISS